MSSGCCFTGSSCTSTLVLLAVSQVGIAGSASSLNFLSLETSKVAYCGTLVWFHPGPEYIGGGCDWYCWLLGKAEGGGDSTRLWPFRGPGQQALQQLRQPQQHSAPQQRQRAQQYSSEKTMRPPIMMAAMTGHLRIGLAPPQGCFPNGR
ncbi:hypothetical protein MPH_04728 [Macrophomina phaseolina MS6]|uniref:Secreted protein n=1 Tax=Macrophomina phaseolina (strain MS6) TaxID=1126212 RepID=K2RTI8_MACPH|nr:hypothetical protein MPH_04728 [Macrophomina phaseolina MS6]